MRRPLAVSAGDHAAAAAASAFVVLSAVYLATLAPGLTFWDAGELQAAIHSLGIPHPPGTPLFILLGRAWSNLLAGSAAASPNVMSALNSAGAGAALAWVITRATGVPLAGLAAALCAGLTSTVWLDATETEIYAPALLLAALMLLAALQAGRTAERRWLVLCAYAMGLAVPLHLSALVAAPAAILLAAQTAQGTPRGRDALILASAALLSASLGLASEPLLVLAGLCSVALIVFLRAEQRRRAAFALTATVVACSVLVFIPIRAAHHPAIDSGHAVTIKALWELVGRRQYDVAGLWPRRAPLWAQLANWFEYADWQFGLGLAPGVAPAWSRTPVTLVYAALGLAGSLEHRRLDRRSWRAVAVLLASASLGIVIYLNFKAGASFGRGVLADELPHEVRERDYFFALSFWSWGAWAGIGAVSMMRAIRPSAAPIGIALAMLPVALNWRAVDRRTQPEASLPTAVARLLLASAPARAVLITDGDNDSFPLWRDQEVSGARRDVSVVVAPLLGAEWYRAQLARRDSLLEPVSGVAAWPGEASLLRMIADRARARGRPVVVAITATRRVREEIGGSWSLRGWVYQSADDGIERRGGRTPAVDTAVTRELLRRFGPLVPAGPPRESTDPTAAWVSRLLGCPARALTGARGGSISLDSACNSQ